MVAAAAPHSSPTVPHFGFWLAVQRALQQQPVLTRCACHVQGGLRVKRLAKRGAEKRASSVKIASPGVGGAAATAAAAEGPANSEGRSVQLSTLTEHGSARTNAAATEDAGSTAG